MNTESNMWLSEDGTQKYVVGVGWVGVNENPPMECDDVKYQPPTYSPDHYKRKD
jgi:hypothetical protein